MVILILFGIQQKRWIFRFFECYTNQVCPFLCFLGGFAVALNTACVSLPMFLFFLIKEGTRLIANTAFAGSGLTSITIPNTATDIGVGAFQYSALTSIIIPNGVTKIWGFAFYHCTSLKSVTLPNSITQIQRDAFRDCSTLTTVICEAIQVPDYQHNIFANIPFLEATLYVPEESLEDYKSAIYWKDFGTILPITQTGLEDTQSDNKAPFIKVIRNGQLLILREGKTYNAMGQEL